MLPEEVDPFCLFWDFLFGVVHQDLVQFEAQRKDHLLRLGVVQVLLGVLQLQLPVPLINLVDLAGEEPGVDCH